MNMYGRRSFVTIPSYSDILETSGVVKSDFFFFRYSLPTARVRANRANSSPPIRVETYAKIEARARRLGDFR